MSRISTSSPRLLWAGGIVVLTLAAAAPLFLSEDPGPSAPIGEAGAGRTTAAVLTLIFEEDAGGTLRVLEAGSGREIRVLAPGEGGFLRGVMRPLRRERARMGAPDNAPYRLERWSDGSLTLADSSASLFLELAAYGATSVEAFAALFPLAGVSQTP
jgi:putative photosynthetic complex assembly protein